MGWCCVLRAEKNSFRRGNAGRNLDRRSSLYPQVRDKPETESDDFKLLNTGRSKSCRFLSTNELLITTQGRILCFLSLFFFTITSIYCRISLLVDSYGLMSLYSS